MKLGRMNHIGVATPDFDASIAFYRDVMGAVVAYAGTSHYNDLIM